METRRRDLLQLQSHIQEIDSEISVILQHLKWDRKHLLEDIPKVPCEYNPNHRIPLESKVSHEVMCRLALNKYSIDDKMLPDPLDNNAKTLVRLSNDNIKQIITHAANAEPSFRKVFRIIILDEAQYLFDINVEIEPQTFDRLQSTYTGDERKAIYDVVVQAAPFCHDLSDLALPSEQGQEETSAKQKSRLEILAELRDMKRRRTKYRVAAKTRNYSDVLRDVIKTQMEVYSDVKIEKSETNISNSKWKDEVKLHTSKVNSFRSTEYNHNNKKFKRERSRSRYDEPSSSKKTRLNDETDSRHKHGKDIRSYGDVKRETDTRSSRYSSRYDDRCDKERIKEIPKEHRKHRVHEERSSKESKKYERSDEDRHKREKHSSSRYHRGEQDGSKRYYSSHDYESRKDKKKYAEYKKRLQ